MCTDCGLWMSTHLQDKKYYISHAKKIPIKWAVSKFSTFNPESPVLGGPLDTQHNFCIDLQRMYHFDIKTINSIILS